MDKNKLTRSGLLGLKWPLKLCLVAVLLLAAIAIVVGFFAHPLLAILEIVLVLLVLVISFYAFDTLFKQANKYLEDLAFRKGRGEQEA
ncbi:hypothetical protein EQ500_06930, partial [Lactobacillus sp. XV13L]|nr:hypothetical protein [Lactobacillus sp. XV13L]